MKPKEVIKVYIPYADYPVYKMRYGSDFLEVVRKYYNEDITLANDVFYLNDEEIGKFDHNYAIIDVDGKKLGVLLQKTLNHIIIYIDTKEIQLIQEHFIYNYCYEDSDFLYIVMIDGSTVKYPKSWIARVED